MLQIFSGINHGRAARIRLYGLLIFVLAGFVFPPSMVQGDQTPSRPQAAMTATAPPKTPSWRFYPGFDLIYRIKQSLRAQKEVFDFSAKQWLRSPEHREILSGECILKPLDDKHAKGNLYLQVSEIVDQGQQEPIPLDMSKLREVAEFTVNSSGLVQLSGTHSLRDTRLILQFIFALPVEGLIPQQKLTIPVEHFIQGSPQLTGIQGSFSFERKSTESPKNNDLMTLHCSVELTTDLADDQLPGSVEWRGSGKLQYIIPDQRLDSARWQIIKLTETNTGDKKLPSKIIELIDIECQHQTSSDYFPILK